MPKGGRALCSERDRVLRAVVVLCLEYRLLVAVTVVLASTSPVAAQKGGFSSTSQGDPNVQYWAELMGNWNSLILGTSEDARQVPPDLFNSGWLGRPGAGEAAVAALEQRLGVRLPPSYREFLKFSNGWQTFGRFVTNPGHLFSTDDVDWVRSREPRWVEIVAEPEYPRIPAFPTRSTSSTARIRAR